MVEPLPAAVDEKRLALLRDLGGPDEPGFVPGLVKGYLSHADGAIAAPRGGAARRVVPSRLALDLKSQRRVGEWHDGHKSESTTAARPRRVRARGRPRTGRGSGASPP